MKKAIILLPIVLAILLTLGALSTMVNALYATTDPWPMYRHDLAHTASGTSTTVPSTNATVWSSPSSTYVSGPPVIVSGMVIFPYSYNLYALDEATGFLLWTSASLDASAGYPTVSAPANIILKISCSNWLWVMSLNAK